MLHRLTSLFLGLSLIAQLLLSASPAGQARQGSGNRAGLELIRSDESGIELELRTPAYQVEALQQEGHTYQRLNLGDISAAGAATGQTSAPSKPQLPRVGVLLGVPAGVQVSLEVSADQDAAMPPLALAPAEVPQPADQELQPRETKPETLKPAGALAGIAGIPPSSQGYFPPAAARIVEDAWWRDQRLVRVELYPFQLSSRDGSLVWHRSLRLALRFSPQPVPAGRTSNATLAPSSPENDHYFEPVLQQRLFNYASARRWRADRAQAEALGWAGQPAGQAPLWPIPTASLGPRYKIVVDQDGLYKLTYADLQAAGLDVAHVDPTTFHMVSQGDDVALHVTNRDGNPHRFSLGEMVLFYGQKFSGERLAERYAQEGDRWYTYNTQAPDGTPTTWKADYSALMAEKYTDENVYWLLSGSAPGVVMTETKALPGGAPVPDSFSARVHAEQSTRWKLTHFTGEESWYWEQIQTTGVNSMTFTTTLPLLAPGAGLTATLSGSVIAMTNNYDASPDHQMALYLNDPIHEQPLLTATWDGKSRYTFNATLPQSKLVEGVNSLDWVVYKTPALSLEYLVFDYFELGYHQPFQAIGDELAFSGGPAGASRFQIGGFSSPEVAVLDISNPLRPVWLTYRPEQIFLPLAVVNGHSAASGALTAPAGAAAPESYQLEFQTTHNAGARYLAAGPAGLRTPKRLSSYNPPDLYAASNQADYLVITPAELLPQAQTLALYRAGQGLTTRVIDIADLFDEFSDGIYNPLAIKTFLAYAGAHWASPKPSFMVLVGDGHWNFKNYSGYDHPPVYMPPNLAWVDPWQGEVDSANDLAAVGGSLMPDVYIGRIPVNSGLEMEYVLSKIVSFESGHSVNDRFLFASDNTPDSAGDFVGSSNFIITKYLSGTTNAVDKVFLNDFMPAPCSPNVSCPPARDALIKTLNITGTLLLNYVGHAGVNFWAGENLLMDTDLPLLANGEHLPILLSMTCLDGYWIHPNGTSGVKSGQGLVEQLLRADQKGVVAAFSPTGLGLTDGHDSLWDGFYDYLFTTPGPHQVGPASLSAKLELYATGGNFDLIETYTIFGDPALQIPFP